MPTPQRLSQFSFGDCVVYDSALTSLLSPVQEIKRDKESRRQSRPRNHYKYWAELIRLGNQADLLIGCHKYERQGVRSCGSTSRAGRQIRSLMSFGNPDYSHFTRAVDLMATKRYPE